MAKTKSRRREIAADLTDKVARSKAIILTDYLGLKVSQINYLRRQIQAAGGDFEVVKNTLLRLAMELKKDDQTDVVRHLNGPTAALFAFDDEVAPVKALVKFAKTSGLPTIKIGVLGKTQILSAADISKLASLPDRNTLIAQLLGSLNAPLSNLVHVLSGNQRKLVYLLSEIAKINNSKEVKN